MNNLDNILNDLNDSIDKVKYLEDAVFNQHNVSIELIKKSIDELHNRLNDISEQLKHSKKYRVIKQNNDKLLIFGTMYMYDDRCIDVVDEWIDTIEKYNPNDDWLLVDSNSNVEYKSGWPDKKSVDINKIDKRNIVSFDDNIGHLSKNGKDGWGRAFTKGIELAIKFGYKWVAHIESDVLFNKNIKNLIFKYNRSDFLTAWNNTHKWVETGLMIMNVEYLKSINFIDKYDWENRTMSPTPEEVVGDIVQWDKLEVSGGRNDDRWMEEEAAKNNQPSLEYISNLSYITHVYPLYRKVWLNDYSIIDNIINNNIKVRMCHESDYSGDVVIFFIGTNKYLDYFKNYYKTCKERLFPNIKKTFCVFTDRIDDVPNNDDIVCYEIDHEIWPICTLLKFYYINKVISKYNKYKLAVFIDADMYVNNTIEFDEMNKDLFGVQHPFLPKEIGTFENNKISRAYTNKNKKAYFQGCLFGGKLDKFKSMINELHHDTIHDLSIRHMSLYHDESYINRYMTDNESYVLGPEYAHPKSHGESLGKIIHLEK